MKRSDLIKLRNQVNNEISRRKLINELLENDFVKQLAHLKYMDINKYDYDTRKIIDLIIDSYEITNTNLIYVCTDSYTIDYDICYEETNYYSRSEEIDSKYSKHKIYKDIESGKIIRAIRNEDNFYKRVLIDEFEKNNLILNPTNKSSNANNYYEVRLDFFENAYKYGQAKSKKLLLEKYPRL